MTPATAYVAYSEDKIVMICGYGSNQKDVIEETLKKAFKVYPDLAIHSVTTSCDEDAELVTVVMY